MQNSTQPAARDPRLFAMPSSGKEPRKLVLRRHVCYAVNLSRAACGQYARACLLCARSVNGRTPSTVSRSQPRGPVYSACSQSADGGGTCRQSMQRGPVWHDATAPQRAHAAQYMQPRQAMQIRPESRCKCLADSPYIHHARRIARATSGHFKRFSSVSVNRRQCSAMQSRPPARS